MLQPDEREKAEGDFCIGINRSQVQAKNEKKACFPASSFDGATAPAAGPSYIAGTGERSSGTGGIHRSDKPCFKIYYTGISLSIPRRIEEQR